MKIRERLLNLSTPVVMGILNVTPDSFFDGGRLGSLDAALKQGEAMLNEGALILDVGGVSTRPGASEVSQGEELQRTIPVVDALHRSFPEAVISIDTWRSAVAREAVAAGAGLINDVTAGRFDAELYSTVAQLGVPYILMHMQGTPATMQLQPEYRDVTGEVLDFFIAEVQKLRALGIHDIVLDPGFGFGKTVAHNFELLKNLSVFQQVLQLPVLAGLSRKSMICKVLKINPEKALNGTTALHMVALQNGARLLRVHDVKAAVEVIKLYEMVRQ